MSNEFLPLDALAATLGLPAPFLKSLAKSGDIPALDVNGRLRFDESAVREALRLLGKRPGQEPKGTVQVHGNNNQISIAVLGKSALGVLQLSQGRAKKKDKPKGKSPGRLKSILGHLKSWYGILIRTVTGVAAFGKLSLMFFEHLKDPKNAWFFWFR